MAFIMVRRTPKDFDQWRFLLDQSLVLLKTNGCVGEPQVFVEQSAVEPLYKEATIIFEWESEESAALFFHPTNADQDKVLNSGLLSEKSSKSVTFFVKDISEKDKQKLPEELKIEQEVKKRLQIADIARTAQLNNALKDADGLYERVAGLLKHVSSVTVPPEVRPVKAGGPEFANRVVLYVEKGTGTRIRIALEEKQAPYGLYVVDLDSNSQEVKALNARGLLPILKDGEVIVHETAAILEYIEMTFPQNPMLFFAERSLRARALTRFHEAQGFAEETMEFLTYVNAEKDMALQVRLARSGPLAERFHKSLTLFERYLTGVAGYTEPPYVAGDQITLGDFGVYVCSAAALKMAAPLGLDKFEQLYPRVYSHYKRIYDRPSVQKVTSD
mmetsp:Transcript_50182/g.83305  ORF Transcript_50182/g.83305 Transcript_50182/m.83305 type:complete len:387 (-) Transcript_50182:339-1499(-)